MAKHSTGFEVLLFKIQLLQKARAHSLLAVKQLQRNQKIAPTETVNLKFKWEPMVQLYIRKGWIPKDSCL